MQHTFMIDGFSPKELIKKYGSPLYVYSADKIRGQYERLSAAFSAVGSFKLHYAMKALSNINILKLIKSLGGGIDAVSINEVKLAIKAGFGPKDIIFTPSGVSSGELEEAVKLGVKINIDNFSALKFIAEEYPFQEVGLRIRPDITAGGHEKLAVGAKTSKFGFPPLDIGQLILFINLNNIKVNGLHLHTGSDIYDTDIFLQAAELLFSFAENFQGLEYLDFGSGFKVKYSVNDAETDIEKLGGAFSKRFLEFERAYGKKIELYFEPGKFLVSEAGVFLVPVNVVKQNGETAFAQLDSGFNHLIRPMFYDACHTILNTSNPGGKLQKYNVTGYICETDNFALGREINEIRERDILAFLNAGAYCFSMSSNYNSRLRPAEVMIYEGKDYLIRSGETFDDLLRNQIEIKIL